MDFTSSGQTQINTINTTLGNKQNTLSNASYLDFTSSGQTQIDNINIALANKQNSIIDGDLTIAKTSGLQSALNSKQNTLSNASYLDFTSSGQTQIDAINTSLNNKQDLIVDGALTIAKTSGLQSALN